MNQTTLDAALLAAGWRFDARDESFRDSKGKRVNYRGALALVPGTTLDDFTTWAASKAEKERAARRLAGND